MNNGEAYTKLEIRRGVPLDYVEEKTRIALEMLHAGWWERRLMGPMGDHEEFLARVAFQSTVKAFLAINNMLNLANDHRLVDQLLGLSQSAFALWIRHVEKNGTVTA